jgi:hypothetical protein
MDDDAPFSPSHLSITTSYRHSLRRFLPVFAGAPMSYNPTATLLEHTLLAQGFVGGAKGHFPSLLATAKPRFDVCKFGRSTQVTL